MSEKKDCSFGIVPLQINKNQCLVFLIKHSNGYWGLPKGHLENHETPQQAAERELFEETGLKIQRMIDSPLLQEHYSFYYEGQKINKTVTYFLAEVSGNIVLQTEEVVDGKWIDIHQAHTLLSFEEAKKIIKQTIQTLEM